MGRPVYIYLPCILTLTYVHTRRNNGFSKLPELSYFFLFFTRRKRVTKYGFSCLGILIFSRF